MATRLFKSIRHSTNLVENIATLFDNSAFSDIEIKVQNTTFFCHKIILQASSKSFVHRLSSETIQNVSPQVFHNVLQFVYTGEIPLDENNIESVLSLSENFFMDSLKETCLEFLNCTLDENNRILYWRLAITYVFPQLEKRCVEQCVDNFKNLNSHRNLNDISENMMTIILKAENLNVKSEVIVCETLLKWCRIRADSENPVQLTDFLALIRWPGIGIDYVRDVMLQNDIVRNDHACLAFISKVIAFLMSGVQFEGLRSFHRTSTDIGNFLVLVGFKDDREMSSDVCGVNLSQPSVVSLKPILSSMAPETTACVFNDSLYVIGVGGTPFRETWKWDVLSDWTRCADMQLGRRKHVLSVADSKLYAIGGRSSGSRTNLKSIESYNPKTNKWSTSGELLHPVCNAACVSYKNSIYIFGGLNNDVKPAPHVQVYNPAQESCVVASNPMPRPLYLIQAVLWENTAILLGKLSCYLYDFDTESWQERKKYKTNVVHFASVLDNGRVYIAGGGLDKKCEEGGKFTWSYTNEVKSVAVLDIVGDKSVVWTQHCKLPRSALICAFGSMTLPNKIT